LGQLKQPATPANALTIGNTDGNSAAPNRTLRPAGAIGTRPWLFDRDGAAWRTRTPKRSEVELQREAMPGGEAPGPRHHSSNVDAAGFG
jgi:hypothetical protein